MTRLLRKPQELRSALAESSGPLGFIPTMGALHVGHGSLIETCRQGCSRSVVSIFVNPLQFGPHEDLERYPRDLQADLAFCEARGVDYVFAPEVSTLYPPGFQSKVEVSELGRVLEGERRPGHFQGVATVLTKLFHLVAPDRAFFGKKDFQQLRLVQRLVEDLAFPIEIVAVPTFREADGLAYSSRNRYLDAEERKRALAFVAGLRAVHQAWSLGQKQRDDLESVARSQLEGKVDRLDYALLVDPTTLEGSPPRIDGPAALVLAGWIGKTRLIDNLVLGEDPAP